MMLLLGIAAALSGGGGAAGAEPLLELKKGDHVCLIGNALAERMQHFGWLEAMLHAKFPEHELVVRNLGFSGDEVAVRQRSEDFGTPEQWLSKEGADVILAFFGFNESFRGPEGLAGFEQELEAFLKQTQAANYGDSGAPRLVLFSPIAQEKHSDPDLPEPENNAHLQLYTQAMGEVAGENGTPFVDLFALSERLYAAAPDSLTFNTIHLREEGDRELAKAIFEQLFGEAGQTEGAAFEKLRSAVNDKNREFFLRYRTVDGYNVYGGRSHLEFDGIKNRDALLREMEIRDVMTANRERRVWALAQGRDIEVTDENLPSPVEVKTNKRGPNPDGSFPYLGGEEAIGRMKAAPGCVVSLFASEEQFPELVNPVQMAFDTKGRLWVAVWPNYPERTPLSEKGDSILIFEDTDQDGKADRCIPFLEDLNCPTGFQFFKDGVLVMQAPDLWWVRDTDGDDRADWKERVLHGIDSADSHHTTNAMCLDPGGATYLSDGLFHRSQVETYQGVVRSADGNIYRYDPRTQLFESYAPYGYANPHGKVFDYWGNDFITDATGNNTYFGPALSVRLDQGKHRGLQEFWARPSRPCPGTGILTSRHFPEEFQGNFLNLNVISFQGIYRVRVNETGSGLSGETLQDHLVQSDDPNFRPICIDVGPDGAVWFCDWHNTIIGHMQHHIRDPNRDQRHGRIYRIIYEGRPLLQEERIAGEPVEKLLDLLKLPENGVRTRAKIELGTRGKEEVCEAVQGWVDRLEPSDPEHEHHLTEALWVHQWMNVVDLPLLERMLESPEHRARAAATRVLCYWRAHVPGALGLVAQRAEDDHPRVRLEAVRAASFFRESGAADAVLLALKRPTDYYLDYVIGEAIRQLEPWWRQAIAEGRPVAAGNAAGVNYLMQSVGTAELLKLPRTELVYQAILTRPGVPEANRLEALQELAGSRGTGTAEQLLTVLEKAEPGDAGAAQDLARLLTLQDVEELKGLRERLAKLGEAASGQAIREGAAAATILADGGIEKVWEWGENDAPRLITVLQALTRVPDPGLRAAAHGRIRSLFHSLPEPIAAATGDGEATVGRYVRIELPRRGTLSLAEVEVWSDGENVARKGTATQSSTAHGGEASRAIDGNRSGVYGEGGQTHTEENRRNTWWELDLGRDLPIEAVTVWNRSEDGGRFASRLRGFDLHLLDRSRNEVFSLRENPAPEESVRIALKGDVTGAIRRAAIAAIVRTGQEQEAVFAGLSRMIRDDDQRIAAAAAIRQLPRSVWTAGAAGETAKTLLRWAATVPAGERTSQDYIELTQLGSDFSGYLGDAEAAEVRGGFRELSVAVFVVKTVVEQLRFDTERLVVEAGKPFEILFENNDNLPHNLLFIRPGTRLEIGTLAQVMLPDRLDSNGRAYFPDHPGIIDGTKLLEPGQKETLKLDAPDGEGEYEFVCTFPGHWTLMWGRLMVTRDVEAYLKENPVAPPAGPAALAEPSEQ